MPSDVEIANLALAKLGDEGEISALTEDSRAARAINGCYAAMRDAVLRDHPWNFATRRVQLAPLLDAPAWGGLNAFELPADFLRLLEAEGDPDWQIEGRTILAATSVLNLRYTARIEDSGLYDPLFAEALACRIAQQLALRITGSSTVLADAARAYQLALAAAKRVDGQDNPPEPFPIDDWAIAREAC